MISVSIYVLKAWGRIGSAATTKTGLNNARRVVRALGMFFHSILYQKLINIVLG